jgi:DNA mismatch endonuclease, patch repair protein
MMTLSDESAGRWGAVPPVRRRIMQANRRRDTALEKTVRSALFAAGLRYRVDYPIRVGGRRPIRPDIVFTRQRVAIFVDGCFWHGCPQHATQSATNTAYWQQKIAENRVRDARNTADLQAEGWTVIRVWEHESVDEIVNHVRSVVADARDSSSRR